MQGACVRACDCVCVYTYVCASEEDLQGSGEWSNPSSLLKQLPSTESVPEFGTGVPRTISALSRESVAGILPPPQRHKSPGLHCCQDL